MAPTNARMASATRRGTSRRTTARMNPRAGRRRSGSSYCSSSRPTRRPGTGLCAERRNLEGIAGRRPPMSEPERPQKPEPGGPQQSVLGSVGVQRQMEIYQAGLKGRQPRQPVAVEKLERKARAVLRPEAYLYVAGGAGAEDTMRANREAFRRWR